MDSKKIYQKNYYINKRDKILRLASSPRDSLTDQDKYDLEKYINKFSPSSTKSLRSFNETGNLKIIFKKTIIVFDSHCVDNKCITFVGNRVKPAQDNTYIAGSGLHRKVRLGWRKHHCNIRLNILSLQNLDGFHALSRHKYFNDDVRCYGG